MLKVIISENTNDRIAEFSWYMKNMYINRFSNTWFNENVIISSYLDLQDKFEEELYNKIYNHFSWDIITRVQPVLDWNIESYYTYFSIDNYSVKLTCVENKEFYYVIVDDITIYSK